MACVDVHPPHSPILGIKDFLLHLLTITVGLLIALGLEAAVEYVHHQRRISEARENIESELADNRRELEKLIPRVVEQQKTLDQMLQTVESARRHNKESMDPRLSLGAASLRRSSYDTAQTSGALGLMPYSDASRCEENCQMQIIFNNVQSQAVSVSERGAARLYDTVGVAYKSFRAEPRHS